MPDTLTPPPPASTPVQEPSGQSLSSPESNASASDTTPAEETQPDSPTEADAWAKLEAKWDSVNKTKEPAAAEPKDEPKTEEKSPDKAAETPPAEKTERPSIQAPRVVRQQLDKANAELKQKMAELDRMASRMKALEGKDKESAVLNDRLTSLQKELAEARASLRAAKQETSPEFQEKYEKPFEEAAETARAEIEQLGVIGRTGQDDTGEPTYGPVRQANFDKDFAPMYGLDYIHAKAKAKELFGDDAGVAMDHWLALHRLDRAKRTALEHEKAQWAERTKADEARAIQQRKAFDDAVTQLEQGMAKQEPELFGEDPKDPEGNALLKEGLALVDSTPKTLREAAALKANIRMRVAAFPRLKQQNKALKAELALRDKTIEELKGSAPGATKRTAGAEAKPEKGFFDDLREALR